jgi:acyl-CoA synthetase (AMP-forming)/AMP-acid ligase II
MIVVSPRWSIRTPPAELARRYRAEGFWNDDQLGRVLDQGLRDQRSQSVCVYSEHHPFRGTKGDVADLARRLAGGLQARGVGPGDVVAFQLPNWVEAIAAFWAAGLLGAVTVPIVHIYGPKELGFILENSGARALITADRFGSRDYLEALPDLRNRNPALETVASVGDTSDSCISFTSVIDADRLEEPPPVDCDAPSVVGFTSGTTAEPKGAIQTHRTLLAEVRQLARLEAPLSALPALTGSPVSHVAAMFGCLLNSIVFAHPINLTDRWDPAKVLQIISHELLGIGGGATYFLTSILDTPAFDPASHVKYLRFVTLGGAPIPTAVADRAESLGISMVRAYGSTEHPSVSAGTHSDPTEKRLHTDGRPMPGVEVHTVDEAGRETPPGKAGEIHTRGPDLFAGYTDPTLTADAFDPQGWFSTGDIGVIDEAGYLTITDRKKDIIIRGGENISAAEVEGLIQRMSGVAEVAVVAAPDPRMGEHACAFVRVLTNSPGLDLRAIQQHLDAAGLAKQKWPEELRIVDDFERTGSGKIKKYILRQQARTAIT